MPSELQPNASLENLKKQAKSLLKAHKAGDPSCCGVLKNLPRLAEKTDEEILAETIVLREVQQAIAQEYGFKSWAKLRDDFGYRKEEVEEQEAETPQVESRANKHSKRGLIVASVLTLLFMLIPLAGPVENPRSFLGLINTVTAWLCWPVEFIWLEVFGNWGSWGYFFFVCVPYVFAVLFLIAGGLRGLLLCRRRTVAMVTTAVIVPVIFLVVLRTVNWEYGSSGGAEAVAIEDLIAAPELYDGQRVRVGGISALRGWSVDTALYASKKNLSGFNRAQAMWLNLDLKALGLAGSPLFKPKMNVRPVVLEGTVKAESKGFEDAYAGTLEDVKWIKCVSELPDVPRISTLSPFPHAIAFELAETQFLEGDGVTITKVVGSKKTLNVGGTYRVSGKYTLNSAEDATLALYLTTSTPSTIPTSPKQREKVESGTGEFSLQITITTNGKPHVSFYPSAGGSSFGGVYFGNAEGDRNIDRIGVYDSRSIAIAFVGSATFKKHMVDLKKQHAEAEARGDCVTATECEAHGSGLQAKLHKQAFSTAPVDNILEIIEEQAIEIMNSTEVDMLASKWDTKTLGKYESAEQIDITMRLVDALKPNDRQRKTAIDIQKNDPVALEEMSGHKH